MSDPLRRLLGFGNGSLSSDEVAWLVSSAGLIAACKQIVQTGDQDALVRLESGSIWHRLIDASPHPLGRSLAARGRSIVAATRLASTDGQGILTPDDERLQRIAPGFACDRDPDPTAAPRACLAAWDLVSWLSGGGRPSPTAVRRVTFLVDEHVRGRVVRLTLARFAELDGFAQDVLSSPFTIADQSFEAALVAAREAIGGDSEGVRWSVTWESGESPHEIEGGSVGLAALVCFDRLAKPHQLGVEASWAFVGLVGTDGYIGACLSEGGEGSYTNKLRAAEQRNVLVPQEDYPKLALMVEASSLSVRLHPARDLSEVLSLLDARQPRWLSNDVVPIIGREPEMRKLEEAAESARAKGFEVRCVTGEPGIGKSRLAREFGARRLTNGWRVAWGTCYEAEATVAYRPVIAILRSLLRWFDERDDIVGDSRQDLALLLPELDTAAARRRSRADVDSERQLAVFDAVGRLVRRAADASPLAIVVEDVHWADRPSLLLLAHMARQCASSPILVLATYRNNEVVGDHPVVAWLGDISAHRPVEQTPLAGLGELDVGELLTHINGQRPPSGFTSSMLRVTEGNPLFVHELARHAQEIGALDPRRDQWNFETDDAQLPAGLLDTLARRVRALSSAAQELLRLVALTPGGASFEVLSSASSIDHIVLLDALDEAVEAGVLEEHPREGIGFVYEFSHVLFRQVLHRRMTAARRARYHLALARALWAIPDPDERWVGEVGYHFHGAGRVGDPFIAVRLCSRAGDLAMAGTAYDDAATQYRRATEAAGWIGAGSPRTLAELQLRQAEALHRAGDSTRRRDLAEQAFARAQREGDIMTMAGAALVHGGARSTYGLPSMKTMDMLAEALAAAGNDGAADAMLEARLLSRLAQETYHVQRFEDAKKMSARALDAMPRDGAPASRAAVMDGRAWTLHTPQDLGDRLALADEMVAEAMQARDPEWEMMARSWRCTALLELGEVAAIDIELDRCAVLAREAPVPSHLFRISTLRCTRAMMSGAFDTGATLAEEAYRIGSTIEPENALQTYCAQMLAACREQGLLVGLVDTAEQMVADFPMVPGWRCALAFVNLEAGITDRAGELFDELAATDFRQVPRDLAWLQAHSYLAEVAVALDRPRPAGLLYRSLKPFAGRNVGLYDIASNGAVDYYLGVLAAATERRTTAIRHLRRAVGFNDRTGQVPAATRARVALAAQLLTGTEPERAESRILLAAAAQVASAGGLVRIATEIEPLASELCGAGS